MPIDFDWVRALDALAYGHTLAAAEKLRELMAAAGVSPLPLSPEERAEVDRLRATAARNLANAEAIEARERQS